MGRMAPVNRRMSVFEIVLFKQSVRECFFVRGIRYVCTQRSKSAGKRRCESVDSKPKCLRLCNIHFEKVSSLNSG